MQYIQVDFTFCGIEEYQKDLLIAELADTGFNTFEDTPEGFSGFINKSDFQEDQLREVLETLEEGIEYAYSVQEVEAENWNETWEKNFEPLTIAGQCYVRATFHEPHPEYQYEIVIDPKMAFGTGHHQTTTMMMEYLLTQDLRDKSVLDMGCGTGILAILSAKLGAGSLVAIDNDEICYLSTIENAGLNNIGGVEAICGSKEQIPDRFFDVILANINRNILLDQISSYERALKPGGSIFFSGFYELPDLQMIIEACTASGIAYVDHKKNGEWVAAHFKKA
ncbi:50S ribosomal protein L11 methyltransferase [Pedobacter faecalis]|uniref:50S ribosomal protein L11 methyltransferase n=1 Tax=Pedobacter faecalis TaxID=3041495 RepID=UPI002549FFAF|nr:50S ribosomal protein L11 methyltransferase [Pedobacter sp. ELA7]